MDSTQDSPVFAITKASPTWPIEWASDTDPKKPMMFNRFNWKDHWDVDCNSSCTVRQSIHVDRDLLGHPDFGKGSVASVAGLLVIALDEWLETDFLEHAGKAQGPSELCEPLNEMIQRYLQSQEWPNPGRVVSVSGALPPNTFAITDWTDQWDKGEPVEYSITATRCDLEGNTMTAHQDTARLIIQFSEKKAHEDTVTQEDAGQHECKLHPPSDDQSDATVNLLKKPDDTEESATADQTAE